MLGVRLFPQVLSDLNFFNVESEQELALRLRTVQRVAVAVIGTCLFVRYEPMLNKNQVVVLYIGVFVGGVCLSAPMSILYLTAVTGCQSAMKGVSRYRENQIGKFVLCVGGVFYCYLVSQGYKKHLADIQLPNLLEKLFKKVEDRVTQPIWDRFYKKSE